MIELVHMIEIPHNKKKTHTHTDLDTTKIECEHLINEITTKIMRHADIEIGSF